MLIKRQRQLCLLDSRVFAAVKGGDFGAMKIISGLLAEVRVREMCQKRKRKRSGNPSQELASIGRILFIRFSILLSNRFHPLLLPVVDTTVPTPASHVRPNLIAYLSDPAISIPQFLCHKFPEKAQQSLSKYSDKRMSLAASENLVDELGDIQINMAKSRLVSRMLVLGVIRVADQFMVMVFS